MAARTGLATSGNLGADLFCVARLVGSQGTNRAITSYCGQLVSARGFWGPKTGPNPTDRAKSGSKRYLICDGRGLPPAIQLTAANCNDCKRALSPTNIQKERTFNAAGSRVFWEIEALIRKRLETDFTPAASFLYLRSATQSTVAGWVVGVGLLMDIRLGQPVSPLTPSIREAVGHS